jgi:diaminohydroxyphosphoribosylaminopyrimidine deaminase/5-amino-6-(5-phosphoribosylamino)uracil reductase
MTKDNLLLSKQDYGNMDIALRISKRGLGNVSPNPAVGCVIVKDGKVIATGRTQPGGRPHAEVVALNAAGENAKGATAYVTLEPCSHYGKTPPCAEAMIKADIKKCVISMIDPDPRVSGRGVKMMQDAGIEVISGCREEEARLINRGFLLHTMENRPFVTLKIASTLDGKISTSSGESKWITSPASRQKVQMLRASHDAVLIGSSTVKADNPSFMCRLPGLAKASPTRFILLSRNDYKMEQDQALKFLSNDIFNKDEKTGFSPKTYIIANNDCDDCHLFDVAEKKNIEIIKCETPEKGYSDILSVLNSIADKRITRLLVEGGSKLATSLIAANVVDELYWFYAPKIIGNEGMSAINNTALKKLSDATVFKMFFSERIDNDVLNIYRKI